MKRTLLPTLVSFILTFCKWPKICALSFLILAFGIGISNAATITTTGSGSWSSTTPNAPWPGGTIPAAGDDIVIGAGFTLTVDGNRSCRTLTVGNGSIISVNTTFILTVSNASGLIFPNAGAASTTGTMTGAGTINTPSMTIGNSTALTGGVATNTVTVTSTITALNISGALTLTSIRAITPTRLSNPVFNLQSGTATVNGTLACITDALGGQTTVSLATGAQTGTLVLANATATSTAGALGTFTFTFNGTNATVNYSNAAAQTAVPTTYQNLTLSGGGIKTTTGVTVNGTLSMEGTATSSAIITYGGSATLQYNTATPRTASTNEWPATFTATGGVIIKSTGQITTPGALQMGNNTNVPLNIQSGASLLAAGLITLHGDFIRVGTFTSSIGITLAGTTATQSIDGFTTSGNVILSKPSGVATFQGNVDGGNLTINSTTPFTGTLNLGASLTHTFTGTWTRTAGTLNGGSSTLKIAQNVSGSGGTFTAGTGTVEWNGTAQTLASGITYNNLILSGSGNKTFTLATTISANLTVSGTAVANLGTFTHTANSLTLGGTGQVGGSHGSSGSAATTKNDTYFLSTSSGIVNVATCTAPSTGTATTYYSRNATSGGNWNDSNSWTTSSDGTGGPLTAGVWPRIYDNVVIRSGHTITVDAITDNNYCGISPDGLANANIGAGGGTGFNGSNIAMFYQTGDVTINGTLSVISGINVMVAGYTRIASTGTFSLPSYLVNAGYLEADASSSLTTLDDLSLTGNSTTIINTSVTSADDLNIDHTNATLCGTGTSALLNSGGSAINYTNSATVAQICTSFTVTCSGGGCAGFPVVGTTSVILGNVGPGGIGNSTNNKLWLRANDLSLANGAAVASWSDISGNSLTATNATAGERPTFVTNSVNGFPSISFDGTTDNLSLGTPAGLNFVPGTNSWSFIIVYRSPVNGASTTPNQGTLFSKAYSGGGNNRNYQYQVDDTPGPADTFGSYIGNTLSGGSVVVNTNTFLVSTHTNTTTSKTSFTNETSNFSGFALGTGSDATTEVLIGARRNNPAPDATEGFLYTGDIAEIMMHNSVINTAQRIIIANYLAAKYAITLSANDIYTMDNPANGNYDYEVAGIGQAADGSNHKDSKSSGIVRMWNPNGLANDEYLFWGHDNATLYSHTTTVGLAGVDGTVIKERLARIWRVTESAGDVGTVSVSFDASLFTTALGSNMMLLIDRDGDGFGDNDVTPVAGSFANNTVVFSGINFQSGDRFTLGNTDLTKPLPIQLIDFKAIAKPSSVELTWTTAMEKNNDFFTVQKSSNPENGFQDVAKLNARGNSTVKQEYFLADQYPYSSLSYYRLKQTDFDGKFTYSKLVSVNYEGSTVASLSAYPNPLQDRQRINVEISGLKGVKEVPLIIYNFLGQKILEKTIMVDQGGMVKEEFFFKNPLSPGVFIVKAGPTLQLTQRLVVE